MRSILKVFYTPQDKKISKAAIEIIANTNTELGDYTDIKDLMVR